MNGLRVHQRIEPLRGIAAPRGPSSGGQLRIPFHRSTLALDHRREVTGGVSPARQRVTGLLKEFEVAKGLTDLAVGDRPEDCRDVGAALDVGAARVEEAAHDALRLAGEGLAEPSVEIILLGRHWHIPLVARVGCRTATSVAAGPPAEHGAKSRPVGYAFANVANIPFDRSALKVGQVMLIAGLVIAWLIALARPAAAVALPLFALMLLGSALSPATSLPRALYTGVLKPRGLVHPRVRTEDPAPHRFAQLVGGVFLVAASITAAFGQLTAAWTLGWVVIALAFLNFAFDVCVGCIVYAQLVRIGLFPLSGRRPAVS